MGELIDLRSSEVPFAGRIGSALVSNVGRAGSIPRRGLKL